MRTLVQKKKEKEKDHLSPFHTNSTKQQPKRKKSGHHLPTNRPI